MPMILFCIYILILYRLAQINAGILPLMLAYSLPPLGKESVIPTGIALGIHPGIVLLLVTYIDITFALFLLWNYELLHKIPLCGRVLTRVENTGVALWNERPWLNRLAVIGLALFVFIPFHGTGATTSALLGRVVGMQSMKTFFAILIGSISSAVFVICFSDAILFLFGREILLIAAFVVIVAVFLLFLRKKLRKFPQALGY
jgi:uncharacterized membrane protein